LISPFVEETMRTPLPVGLVLTFALAVGARAQPPLIKVPVPAATPSPARDYELLPDAADVVPGNAAPMWLRAAIALRQPGAVWPDEEGKWGSSIQTPLRDLPRAEVRKFVDGYAEALRLADQAARRDHCEWELPPLTLQAVSSQPLEPEVQTVRLLASLLNLRVRLELAEGHPDKALHALQVGMALGRDIGKGPTAVHGLVGVAITMIMLGRVEEIMQQPQAPNLYWAITELPRPLVDLRMTLRSELGILGRSYPELGPLERGRLTGPQAQAIVEAVLPTLARAEGQLLHPRHAGKLDLAHLVETNRADARRYLTAHGRKADEVDALTDRQAVALYLLERYRADRTEVLRWSALPAWEGREHLLRLDKRLREEGEQGRGALLGDVLFPFAAKVQEAGSRLERQVAAVRCVEAIRLHAASHGGKLPAALADVTEVPLPLDPYTGKGFDSYYKVSGDTAVLDIPPPPGMAENLGRRYELTRAR
jgi:hypothetical protein